MTRERRSFIVAVLSSLAMISVEASSNESGIISFHLHPTAQLTNGHNVGEQSHRNLQGLSYKHAIYGPLEYFDPATKEKLDETRHISRFERALQEDEKSKSNNRALASTDNNQDLYQLTPLFQGYGTHYATVWVGTPPQRKSVIVDTGSHFTAFPCVGCKNCGEDHHTDSFFDPSKSSTFHALNCDECGDHAQCNNKKQCTFSQSYTEGSSWSAYQARDRFFVGSSDVNTGPVDPIDNSFAIPFMFGCQYSETGLFVTQLADGIMGMSAHAATLPKRMYDQNMLAKNMFSMCFKRELNVSKNGIAAGVLTLGGIDTRLNSSPMVYAKNTAPSGWYTVKVKNIFVRKGGGMSAALEVNDENKAKNAGENLKKSKVVRLPIDVKAVNSGKGVIVDSGTTDTYLSKTLAKGFMDAWKDITGVAYSNSALKLTKKEVAKLPTLLIQLEGWTFEEKQENDLLLGIENAVGVVGALDPSSPGDVLLAVPADHYMEYSPSRDTYTSRLYFTESKGGVIGANAMQGHDVLFDWENGRVGFAESSCDYSEIAKDLDSLTQNDTLTNDGSPPKPVHTDEGHAKSVDCVLSQPSLAESCLDSVKHYVHKCNEAGADENTPLHPAHEKWALVIEKNGSGMHGASCHKVAKNSMSKGSVTCSAKGTCTIMKPCAITCEEVWGASSQVEPKVVPQPPPTSIREGQCGDDTWGACTSWCSQSKIHSFVMDDGKCHEDESKQESRPCHIDACGSHDPCRVPFVVHAVIGLADTKADLWSKRYEETFIDAFAASLNGLGDIGPGDVDVLMVNQWTPEGKAESSGMKLILEVSIYNNTKVEEKKYVPPPEDEDLGMFSKLAFKFQNGVTNSQIISDCSEEMLYPFASTALDLHTLLQRIDFVDNLVGLLPNNVNPEVRSPYDQLNTPAALKSSKVITSWTILTHKGSVHDHSQDHTLMKASNFTKKKLKGYVHDYPFMLTLMISMLFLLGIGVFVGNKCKIGSRVTSTLSSRGNNVAARVKQIRSNAAKGKYAKVEGLALDGDVEMA